MSGRNKTTQNKETKNNNNQKERKTKINDCFKKTNTNAEKAGLRLWGAPTGPAAPRSFKGHFQYGGPLRLSCEKRTDAGKMVPRGNRGDWGEGTFAVQSQKGVSETIEGAARGTPR